ncbi:eCIS core domain-containing protein [Streptomyces narbonensis]|uniref:eCIS core domain-containing protein n=1 Tax=Streptomyces narbonensis TaxID=67333 RepID=UPI0019B29426|nr:DUF4157 domain-containing protein [Streptomyces narbonensis]GGW00255.1 hypothetical protein GCM10010230_27920 [Streptomyces narbonensis]
MRTPSDGRTNNGGQPDRAPDGRAAARRGPESSAPGPDRRLPLGAGNAAVVQMLRQAGHPWAQEQHRHGAGCGHGQQAEPSVQRSAVHDVLRGPGRALDESTRTDMEARLGADFSDVRVHDDSAAKASAAEVGARAYTSGSHVVIGAGGADSHTLAHELTHVIQQRRGPVAGTDNGSGLRVSDPSDRFEREAEANARRVMAGPAPASQAPAESGAAVPTEAGPSPSVQRAIGLEVEVDRPVVRHTGTDVKNGNSTGIEMMEHPGQGIKLVSDSRGTYTNAEFVAEPSAVLPGEGERFPRTTEQTIAHLEEAHRRLYTPEAGSPQADKQMRKLYPESQGYAVTPGFKMARVAPEKEHVERNGKEGKGQGLFIHQTVGLPLNGMTDVFAEAVQTPEPRNRTGSKVRALVKSKAHDHLVRSVQVGNELGARFLQSPAAAAPAHQVAVGAQEVRGFGSLCYTQFAALADKLRADDPERPGVTAAGQVKNKTAVLARVSLGTVQQSLPDPAKLFLVGDVDAIRDGMWAHYFAVAPRTGPDLPPMSQESIDELNTYLREALSGIAEFLPPADDPNRLVGPQERAFGGMTELTSLDSPGGVPVVPLEFRSFGVGMASFADLRQDVGHLENWSKAAHGTAAKARSGEQQREFTPIEVTAPWSVAAPQAAAPQAAPQLSHEQQFAASLERCRQIYTRQSGNPATAALAPFLQIASVLAPRGGNAQGPAETLSALEHVMTNGGSLADVQQIAARFTEWATAVGMAPQMSRPIANAVAAFGRAVSG